jgi:hypothetical protein
VADSCEYSTDFGIYRIKSGLVCLASMENNDPDLVFERSSVKSDSLAVKPLKMVSDDGITSLTFKEYPISKSFTTLPDKREIFPRFPPAAIKEVADFNSAFQSKCAG